MFSLIDISPHLIQPPFVLMRENKFPDCPRLFVEISAAQPRRQTDRLWIARKFTGLCRLTGWLYGAWATYVVLLIVGAVHWMYHELSKVPFEGTSRIGLRCLDLQVSTFAMFFVLMLAFEYATGWALNVVHSCREFITSETEDEKPHLAGV
jgi:hypothetical protein